MALGSLYANVGPALYNGQPQRVDLNPGVNIHALILRLTATVTVAGGTTSGTLLTEGVQRLINAVRIRHDGDDRVSRISGRALARITRRTRMYVRPAQQLADPDAQAATVLSADLVIPIAQPWLAQPALTAWPGSMRVRQELALYVEWNTAVAGTGASDAGTGALISGGDRAVTWDEEPQLQVVQQYSLGALVPWYLTRISAGNVTQGFAAATASLPFRLDGAKKITAILHRALSGTAFTPDAFVNTMSLEAAGGSNELWDRIDYDGILEGIDQGSFPAAGDDPLDGELFSVFTDNGLLSTYLDPTAYTNPRIVYDVAAPASGTGYVDLTIFELDELAGVTLQRG